MRFGWALTALFLSLGPVWAEGFAARGLGRADSAELCTKKAGKVLETYLRDHGGDEILPTANAVYGWDFEPGQGDVMLMCPTLDDGSMQAMLIVHSEGTDQERDALADAIGAVWGGS